MDRQIKAERAWIIPFEIKEHLGSFKFHDLIEVPQEDYIKIFNDLKLHRFNNTMAIVFFEALELVESIFSLYPWFGINACFNFQLQSTCSTTAQIMLVNELN